MKLNKKYIIIRLLTFPIKLLFTVLWMLLCAIMLSFRWLFYGSTELYFSKNFNTTELSKIVQQNEDIIKMFNP